MNEATVRNMSNSEFIRWVENRPSGFIASELNRRLDAAPEQIDCENCDPQGKSDMDYFVELIDGMQIDYERDIIKKSGAIITLETTGDWTSTVEFGFDENGEFKTLECFE